MKDNFFVIAVYAMAIIVIGFLILGIIYYIKTVWPLLVVILIGFIIYIAKGGASNN